MSPTTQALRVVQEGAFEPAFLTSDPGLSRQLAQLWKIARADAPFLITGPTGTGKSLLARDAHEASRRAGRPFVVVDCPSLPADLAESILFGHEKGAFTGADAKKLGLLATADGGTVLLDELADLPLGIQAKLLRVIQEKVFRRVSANDEEQLDVRFIGATNKDLAGMVQQGSFRLDLYHRLCTWTLSLPPLAARPGDIRLLAAAHLRKQGLVLENELTPEAIAALQGHDWPGNVRELENVLNAALALRDGPKVEASDLRFQRSKEYPVLHLPDQIAIGTPLGIRAGDNFHAAQKLLVEATYRACGDNYSAAARCLGVTRSTVRRILGV